MFDSDTAHLIATAPPLEGVDLTSLPQQLTSAYTAIVAARIRLQNSAIDADRLPAEVAEVMRDMKRLAFTYEAMVAATIEREDRASAAFVAGAAHHMSLMAERLRDDTPRPSTLGYQSISPAVSGALLFLIAEATADAAEMAKAIVVDTADPIERAILVSVEHLAHGRLRAILQLKAPTTEDVLAAEASSQPVRALYLLLFQGLVVLAASMLGEPENPSTGIDEARELFNRARALCVEPIYGVLNQTDTPSYSLYPGPLHLGALLAAVSNDLFSSALVNVPPPAGVDGGRWLAMMRELAGHRPYLWRNHRQAVSAGYLNPGTSAAISFPTGAGKSTVSELKIAVALLSGVKVIFLAPTLSLVDQTARSLTDSFPKAAVQRERAEELLFDFDGDALPAISVMTPERCLALIGFDSTIFADVGLMIFDECHLLHPRDTDRSRRALDAMLCVLNFTAAAPAADLLFLSAMMSNCEEMGAWLQQLTGRPCLSLALTWKPTRQVRGCVVYGETEIGALKTLLHQVRAEVTNKDAPAGVKRSLKVQPFGFFCLHQTWHSKSRKDYALLPILHDTVTLSSGTAQNRKWYLTPNGNQVASNIAAAVAKQRIKTLVFTQTITLSNSASSAISTALGVAGITFTESEHELYVAAVIETGGREHVYLQVNSQEEVVSSSACHHGLLLPMERHLHESLFRRRDGLHVLVATSTLAQGMNLPSEVVIIAGDSRFDPDADKMAKLEAHELLNAAGRAGRAGEGAYGFVLVVPSKVVHFNDETSTIHSHWTELQAIFAQSDQCLEIDDPLRSLLDQVHSASGPLSELATYFIRRLPVGDGSHEDSDAPARALLGRSFAAYKATAKGDVDWVQNKVGAALALRKAAPDAKSVLDWADRLAAAVGIPVTVLRALGEPLSKPLASGIPMGSWYAWVVQWLTNNPELIPQLIRRESLEGLFGSTYKALTDDKQRGALAGPALFKLLECWMKGETLVELELVFGIPKLKVGKCEYAREFVLRIVPELAYIFSVPSQVYRALMAERGEDTEPPAGLGSLGSCVKEGFDSVEKLALRHHRKASFTRRLIHQEFAEISPYIASATLDENFLGVKRRIKAALEMADL